MLRFLRRHYYMPLVAFVLVIALMTQVIYRSVEVGKFSNFDTTPTGGATTEIPIGGESLDKNIPTYNPNLKPDTNSPTSTLPGNNPDLNKDGNGNWDLSGWAPPEAKLPIQLGNGNVLNPINNFVYAAKDIMPSYYSHNSALSVEVDPSNNALVGYALSNNLNVAMYAEAFDNYFSDSVVINQQKEVVNAYYAGSMQLDYAYSDEFDCEYIYDEQGRIEALFLYGFYFDVTYAANNQPNFITKNGEAYLEYLYNSQGSVVTEINHALNLRFDYDYDGNRLLGKTVRNAKNGIYTDIKSYAATPTPITNGYAYNGASYIYSGGKITLINDGMQNISFGYGESEEYSERIVSRTVNGQFAQYYYLEDRIVRDSNGGYAVDYIINGADNPIGLSYNSNLYYFVFDPNGNVFAILDASGNIVVTYEYNSLGELLNIGGSHANIIGDKNGYLISGDYYYDHALGIYYTEGGVYDPAVARAFLSNGRVQENGNVRESASFEHKPLSLQLLIEDKVKEVLLKSLNEKNILATVNAATKDNYNRRNGAIDIFTLPVDLTNLNFANVVNGNQAYIVIPQSQRNYAAALTRLNRLMPNAQDGGRSEDVVSLFNEYSPTKGTVIFSGGFIYLNRYVTYESMEDGIITYTVQNNDPSLYKSKNVYSFDINGYELFSESLFKADLFTGFKIAPGFNQEDYIIAENEFYCAIELTGRIASRTIPYTDANAATESMRNTLADNWNNWASLPSGKQLVLGEQGSIDISDIEFKYPSNVNWAQIGKIVLVTIAIAGLTILTAGTALPAGGTVLTAVATGISLQTGLIATSMICVAAAYACIAVSIAFIGMTAFTIAEIFTGENWLKETIFSGNEEAYYTTYSILGMVFVYTIATGYQGYQYNQANQPRPAPQMANKGSSADGVRSFSEPQNLNQQLGMEQAKSNPLAGEPIVNKPLGDGRWPGSEGWIKMKQSFNGFEVHYVYNDFYNLIDDFKIILKGK